MSKVKPCAVEEHGLVCGRQDGQYPDLCSKHYKRVWKYGDPLKVRNRRDLYKDDKGRECTSCLTYKTWNDFYTSVAGTNGRTSICAACHRGQWHNLSCEELALLSVDDKCHVPGCENEGTQVDHDHTCCPGSKSCGQCVRGRICHYCNATLGNARDDIKRLNGLIEYLGRPNDWWR